MGGMEGEEAAAAMLRCFPGSGKRDEFIRLTLIVRKHPDERSFGEPWVLVNLAWGLFPPSGMWADFNEALRRAALASHPKTLKEKAIWVLALSVFYSAPEGTGVSFPGK